MAPDAGGPLAEAYVTILPDMDRFVAELAAKLDAATSSLHPTVKVKVEVDDAGAIADTKVAQGLVDRFGNSISTAKLQADDHDALIKVAEATAAARKFAGSYVGKLELDNAGMIAQAASQTAWMENLKKTLPGQTGVAGGILDSMAIRDSILPGGAGGGSAGSSPTGQVADAATKGLLQKLLWGGASGRGSGGVFGIGTGLAAAGSLGSLAGFGPEHLLTTGVGLAGSAVGAGLGAGLLGAGALGVAGVGMGTDLAGIGQASGDIKNTYSSMMALNTAVAAYGPNTQQAVAGQTALNTTLAGFSPVARSSVIQAANMAQTLHALFNQVSGQAENTGAQIITSFMGVAEKYIPTVGKYATENMSIIKNAITGPQGIESWLSSGTGGLGIFTELEKKFQSDLPTAIHAATQATEFFGKSLGFLSNYTGGFMQSLDALFTRLNSPEGFSHAETIMAHLISDFHSWDDFIKILIKDIADLFKADAGTAQSILASLTAMLVKFHEWETSTAGQARLSSIFTQHKQQILDLLAILPDLLRLLSPISAIMPVMVAATLPFIKIITDLLGDLERLPLGIGPAVAAFLGLFLVLAKLTSFSTAWKVLTDLPAIFTGLGEKVGAVVPALGIVSEETGASAVAARVAAAAFEQEAAAMGLTGDAAEKMVADLAAVNVANLAAAEGGGAAAIAKDAEGGAAGLAGGGGGLLAKLGIGGGAGAAAEGDATGISALTTAVGGLGVALPLLGIGIAGVVGGFEVWHTMNTAIQPDVANMISSVTTLPTQTLPQLQDALAAAKDKMAGFQGQTKGMSDAMTVANASGQQLSNGMTAAGDASGALGGYINGLNAKIKEQHTNLNTLSSQFHITGASADDLANSIDLNLNKKLDPTDIMKFKQALDSMTNASGMNASALDNLAKSSGTSMAVIANASSQAGQAMTQTLNTMNNLATGITTGLAAAGGDITNFYNFQNTSMTNFSNNISKAMALGFSPAVMQQVMTAGPQAGAAALQALLSGAANNVNGDFVQMTNSAQTNMTFLTQTLTEQAQLMAATARVPGVAQNLQAAMATWQNLVLNGGHQLSAGFTTGVQGGMSQVIQTMDAFGMTVPTHLASGGATAAATAAGQQVLDAYTQTLRKTGSYSAAEGAAAAVQFEQGVENGIQQQQWITTFNNNQKAAWNTAAAAAAKGGQQAGTAATGPQGLGAPAIGAAATHFGTLHGGTYAQALGGAKVPAAAAATAVAGGASLVMGGHLGDFLLNGSKSGTSFVTGLGGKKGDAGNKGKEVGQAGADGAGNADAKPAGQKVVQGIIDGIDATKGKLNTKLYDVVKGAENYVIPLAGGQLVGKAVINGVTQGLQEAAGPLGGILLGVVKNAIQFAAGQAGGQSIGAAIANGIAAGISGSTAVQTAAATAVNNAKTAATNAANVNSPSRLFRDQVGLPIALGIAAGMTGGPATDALTAAAVKSINTTMVGLGLRPAGAGYGGAPGAALAQTPHPTPTAAAGPTTNSTVQNNYINMGASSATAGDMVSALSHALRTAAV